MEKDICPSTAKSWGADGTHLFVTTIAPNRECFYCATKEEEGN